MVCVEQLLGVHVKLPYSRLASAAASLRALQNGVTNGLGLPAYACRISSSFVSKADLFVEGICKRDNEAFKWTSRVSEGGIGRRGAEVAPSLSDKPRSAGEVAVQPRARFQRVRKLLGTEVAHADRTSSRKGCMIGPAEAVAAFVALRVGRSSGTRRRHVVTLVRAKTSS